MISPETNSRAAVDFKDLHQWRNYPNMIEGYVGKFTSPFSSDTDSIKCGHEDVTQFLPQFETFV
jgi:hypothetical protein